MSRRLPPDLSADLDHTLETLGAGRYVSLEVTGGGSIAETARVRTSGAGDFFLKWARERQPVGIFTAEVRSLEALAHTGTLRVPRVEFVRDGGVGDVDPAGGPRWLLLEWLEPGGATARTWPALGNGLAALHRMRAPRPGWPTDNFIGSLPQQNAPAGTWPAFWRERRLLPQLELARDGGRLSHADSRRFDPLLPALDDILAPGDEDGASLLHGDLWHGNLHVLASSEPALVDPSSFHGHREVDLAMSELFGGFDPAFLAAYDAAWPRAPGYERTRRFVYQLYYLLVHLNLFGASYRAGVLEALRSIGF